MTTPIGNGGILEKYSWTQTAYDLTICPGSVIPIKELMGSFLLLT